ncbi:MAG: heme exporter protein CcmB [Pseudomonadota bacterium]
MSSKLLSLSLYEIKRSLCYNMNWISAAIFLIINISLFPFTIDPRPELLHQLFLSVVITSILLGIVIMTNHIFEEDVSDGSLNQYIVFGIPMYQIFLAKLLAAVIEFSLVLSMVIPTASIFYYFTLSKSLKILLVIILSTPLFASISIFGSMIAVNLRKNIAFSLLLIFPLLISSLIIISLAAEKIILTDNFEEGFLYIQINIGMSLIIIPVICLISKYIYK